MSQPVISILDELKTVLQDLALWQSSRPSDAALASTQPFALDTLEFHQWLQFILIERLQTMILLAQPLPTSIAIFPMAEEVYKDEPERFAALLAVIARLDMALTGNPAQRTH